MGIKGHSISPFVATLSVLIIGLAVITYSLLSGAWYIFASICFFPFLLIMAIQVLKNPFVGVCLLFTFNYFFIPWYRYTQGSGLSVWYDVATVTLLVTLLVYSYHQQGKIAWKYAKNILTFGGCIWAIYTAAEILNPTALTEAWVYSRGTIYNTLVVSLISVLTMTTYKRLRIIMLFLSVFTLIAVVKAVYQKYAGFDETETAMLIETEMYKTHLLSDVTRYFSFFTDAGNFGSNMGFAAVLFGISAIFTPQRSLRLYYIAISAISVYALFISGTRGALYVPIGGLLLFILISKNTKLMVSTTVAGSLLYVFFAFTYIGEGNIQIRRMRTAFKPTQDASFNVRKDNQKKLAQYLKDKPFGAGLGLGGVEANKYVNPHTATTPLTATIPHDSYYVKLWMETGIVGLILYLTIYAGSLLRGCYLIMFRIKNKELRGALTGIACGIFGLMISAYGNAFFGQFPTGFMVILFLSTLVNGEHIDQLLTKQLKKQETTVKIK